MWELLGDAVSLDAAWELCESVPGWAWAASVVVAPLAGRSIWRTSRAAWRLTRGLLVTTPGELCEEINKQLKSASLLEGDIGLKTARCCVQGNLEHKSFKVELLDTAGKCFKDVTELLTPGEQRLLERALQAGIEDRKRKRTEKKRALASHFLTGEGNEKVTEI
ncbi:MAG: hypothetical protein E6G97_17855 [Alphaproteobacteria bacterium]|nr:MAG: hypothetical protein E6G97_17855 [Alphaproteobacteria bacterium]